jgi:hypothetical protein
MTPIDFDVTMSKFNITGALNGGMVSVHFLEIYLSQSHISYTGWS